MSGIKLDIEAETSALLLNIAALQAMTRKSAQETVRTVSVWILQAGAAKTKQSPANRKIKKVVRRFRHGLEELVEGARVEAPGDQMLWMIRRPRHRRGISKTGGRSWWVFETAAAAREHKKITYQGIGKAGFWAQLPALGKPIPKGFSKKSFLATTPGICSTEVQLDAPAPAITVTNSVRDIARQLEDGGGLEAYILSSVNNRIAGYAKSNEKKLQAFRQAGGVAWDDETHEYDIL